MCASKGKLHIVSGILTECTLKDKLREYEKMYPESSFVLHFRLATSGMDKVINCHPFRVNDNVGVVHNGVFTAYSNLDLRYSDTYMFNENVLKPMAADGTSSFLRNPGISFLLESYCTSSKLVFMDETGTAYIVNEPAGKWNGDKTMWASCKYQFEDWNSEGSLGNTHSYNDYDPSKLLSGTHSSSPSVKCDCCDVKYPAYAIEHYDGWVLCWQCAEIIFRESVKCNCGQTFTPESDYKGVCRYCGQIWTSEEIISYAMGDPYAKQ